MVAILFIQYGDITSPFVSKRIPDANNYTELFTGNCNIFLSVPHDGTLLPLTISNRTDDALGNMQRDTNTLPVATIIRNTLISLFSNKTKDCVPWMMVNYLHRIKMDPNRNSTQCCKNASEASYTAWQNYQNKIRQYFSENFTRANNVSKALLLDIHGQGHPEGWVELGYALSANHLNTNANLTSKLKSSICNLATLSNYTLDNLIRGNVSLGNQILKRVNGSRVVPSPNDKSPGNGSYYDGSYIIENHGSLNCNLTNNNAIQMELPKDWRNTTTYSSYATSLANAIFDYYNLHF